MIPRCAVCGEPVCPDCAGQHAQEYAWQWNGTTARKPVGGTFGT